MRMKMWQRIGIYALLGLLTVGMLLPVIWTVLTSFKLPKYSYSIPPQWIFKPVLVNYVDLIKGHGPQEVSLRKFFTNSIIVSLTTTFISMIVAIFASYSLARFPIGRKRIVNFLILGTRMIPPLTIAIPLFVIFHYFNLLDSLTGLVLGLTALNLPLAIWILRGFFLSIPYAIEEAAMLDGCSHLQVIYKIVLPISGPGLAAASIFCFILTWNEAVLPLVLTSVEAVTLPVAAARFRAAEGVYWGQMCAYATIFIAPAIVFTAVVQKHLLKGWGTKGVKY